MILPLALFFLIGCSFALTHHLILLFPLLALLFLSDQKIQGCIFCLLAFVYTSFHIPTLDEGVHTGKGIFKVESIAPSQSPFATSYMLKGKLLGFEVEEKTHYSLPCVLFQKKAPSRATRYYVEGKYEKGMFKPTRSPLPLDSKFSLPHLRFQLKENIRAHFHTLSDRKVGHFFASMATADVDSRLLSMEFRKWGLSHILAISGFHFALIALGFSALLRLIFPHKLATYALLFVLTLAFAYLGPTPSILRAYLMITLFLLGQIVTRNVSPLNLLGVALLFELTLAPLHAKEVGFQLSYLATFGILAFYSPIEKAFCHLLPKQTKKDLSKMTLFDKHGYLLGSALRSGLALNTAVHLTTLPVILFSFHTFPLMSFVFNLFLPPLLGISLLTLPLCPLNVPYTRFLLNIISEAPEMLNFKLVTPNFPFPLVIVLCTLLGCLGLTRTSWIGQNKELF